MTRIICLFVCTSILHNLLIHEPVTEEWAEEIAALAAARNDDDDDNNLTLPEHARTNKRRNTVYQYTVE